MHGVVAERTSYFCLARKLIWPLWSSHIFTQWGWLILFNPDHFPRQHKNGESPPNYLFLRTFRAGRTYFLSAPFIAAESQHHAQTSSYLIPGQHFLETFMPLSYNKDHTFMGVYIIHYLNQQTRLWRHIFRSDIQHCFDCRDAHFPQAFSCYNSFSAQ